VPGKKGAFDGKAGQREQMPSISHATYINTPLDACVIFGQPEGTVSMFFPIWFSLPLLCIG